MNLDKELDVALRLARAAGETILSYYDLPPSVDLKVGNEPVTVADRAANEVIVSGLAEAFPDDGILAEESPDTVARLAHERLWVIDPMDGTKEFIKKNGEFSIMIGLALAGRATLGVVYQPTRDRMFYTAGPDAGAWLVDGAGAEPQSVRVSDVVEPAEMSIAVSRSHRAAEIDQICSALGIEREVRSGSVGLKVGLICERHCDLYIHPSPQTKQWDTCAPEAILAAAGGRMTDLAGTQFVYNRSDLYNRKGILATNGRSHERILARVAEAFGAA